MNQDYNKLTEQYRHAFNTPSGQAVLEDLEKAFHVHYTTFRNSDVHEMGFNEGQRSVVLYIKGMMIYKSESKPEETEE